jgi:hypothetical protein
MILHNSWSSHFGQHIRHLRPRCPKDCPTSRPVGLGRQQGGGLVLDGGDVVAVEHQGVRWPVFFIATGLLTPAFKSSDCPLMLPQVLARHRRQVVLLVVGHLALPHDEDDLQPFCPQRSERLAMRVSPRALLVVVWPGPLDSSEKYAT